MEIPQTLLKEFAALTNDTKRETGGSYAYGTATVSDDEVYVTLDGSDILTPASNTVEVKNGDRVMVLIKNHSATITGNITVPSDASGEIARAAQENARRAGDAALEAERKANEAIADAADAKNAAESAAEDAESASQSALEAATSAYNAGVSAQNASDSADRANTAATNAERDATAAKSNAETAKASADSAVADAALAKSQAAEAVTSANEAKASATKANTYATAALDQLGIVEDVVGVLNWATEHGTFVKTTDTAVAKGKVYFTYDSTTGDYTPVISPQAADLSSYYELSEVKEAMRDFIMAHLAVTSRGLWVLPKGFGTATDAQYAPDYKALLSNDGMYIYDGNGVMVSKYGESIEFNSTRPQRIGGTDAYIEYYDSNGDGKADSLRIVGAKITIGGTQKTVEEAIGDANTLAKASGSRNYLVGTANPLENAINVESGFVTCPLYATYMHQELGDFGFAVGDKVTLSFDWEQKPINILPYPYYETTKTSNGITFVDNKDGSVTINGTATASTRFYFRSIDADSLFTLTAGSTYKIVPGASFSSSLGTFEIALWNDHTYTGSIFRAYGDLTFTMPENVTYDRVSIYMLIQNGQTVNNLTLMPELYCISKLGTFWLESYGGRTSDSFGYIAKLSDTVTPSASNLSGHEEKVITLTAATLRTKKLYMRQDNMIATIKLSNVKFERGDTATAWTSAPEDASIGSPGTNMLRGTNSMTALATGGWPKGEWRSASSGAGTRTFIDVSETALPKIARGVEITSKAYVSGASTKVAIGQNSVPNLGRGKAYTLSCYAKGTGYLSAGIGINSWPTQTVYLDNVTDWTRYTFYITVHDFTNFISAANKTNAFFWVTGVDADIVFCGMKMEEGICATDWTPAPEDVDTSISAARDVADGAQSSADALEESLNSFSESTNEALDSLNTELHGDGTESNTGIAGLLNLTRSDVSELSTDFLTLADDIHGFMKFGTSEGHPVLTLGSDESDFKMNLTNEEIQFLYKGVVLAYLTGNALRVNDLLSFGNFVVYQRDNGHFTIKYVGSGGNV